MTAVGFEPKIAAGERSQTYAVDRAATGTGSCIVKTRIFEVRTVDFLCMSV